MLGIVSGKATPSSPKPSTPRAKAAKGHEAMMQRSSAHARGSPDLCDSPPSALPSCLYVYACAACYGRQIGWGKYHADDAHDASARARRGAGFVIFCLVGWKGPDT